MSKLTHAISSLRFRLGGLLENPLYRNGYALILSSGSTSVLGLVYWALAARLYDPQILGLSSAALSAVLFLSGIAQLSLSGVLLRFLSQAGNHTPRLVAGSYLISTLLAIPVCVIFLLGLHWWAPSLKGFLIGPWSIVFFFLTTISWSIFVLQDSAFAGLRQSVWVPVENTVFSLVKIGLLILLIRLIPTYGILISWLIPVVLTLLPVNLLLFKRLIPEHILSSPEIQKPILYQQIRDFIGGNYVGTLFFMAYTTLIPIMVTELAGPSENGYFYLPWTIIGSLQLVANNMTISLTVEAGREEAKMEHYSRRVLINVSVILIPITILILFGAPYIMRVFGTAYALHGSSLLRILALGLIPHLFIALSISLDRVRNRTRSIMVTQGILCLLILGASYFLLPTLGIKGVGIAWLGAYTIVAIFLLVTRLWKVLWIKMPSPDAKNSVLS